MGSSVSLNNAQKGNAEQDGKLLPKRTAQLKRELKEKDDFLQRKEAELQYRQLVIDEKDMELTKLRKEIHELKCVVQQTARESSILSMIQEDREMAAVNMKSGTKDTSSSRKEKRMAVSGESSSKAQENTKKELERHPKDFRLVFCSPCCLRVLTQSSTHAIHFICSYVIFVLFRLKLHILLLTKKLNCNCLNYEAVKMRSRK